ncbi:MAG: histidine--tRNA ligase, partial [Ferruginibacter sp.]
MAKPAIPQGTRDFSSETIKKRNYILNTIKSVFELYGFEPLETPALENLSTLLGKYGDEGDKLIFKVLNNGLNDPKNIEKSKAGFEKVLEGKNSEDLTGRALRYDLTIPLARHIAMNAGQITMPYKRYQIQQVWRADRPQRGRYREFTQCDADIVGSYSLINEIELANIYHLVFTKLNLPDYELKINSRKILSALARLCGGNEKMTGITVAIDKLDKIGLDKVKEELIKVGLNAEQIQIVSEYLEISGVDKEKLEKLSLLLANDEEGKTGIKDLTNVIEQTQNVNVSIDFTLARGLNYYTGIIYEVKAPPSVKMGSIGGGGRYDDLTGLFGLAGVPGVGISFGVDRIYDVLEELNLFPSDLIKGATVMFLNLGEEEAKRSYSYLKKLRDNNIS